MKLKHSLKPRVYFLSLFLALALSPLGYSQVDVVIQSFDSSGQLHFNEVPNAEHYRIEWAPSVDGPWTNFAAASLSLDLIAATGSGIVTSMVPMLYRVVATVINPAAPTGMILIPGGTNSGSDPDSGPYSLTVDSFYMDRYLVTKSLWDEVYVWATHTDRGADFYSFDSAGFGKGADYPVHDVSWYDVVKWCNARSEREGRPAVYTVNGSVYRTGVEDDVVQTSAAGYRLPTDVEWVYAARGGLHSLRFPWGNEITHVHANYYSDSSISYDTSNTRGYHPTFDDGIVPFTSPVGSFAPNGYGLYDMIGNVFEWIFDWLPSFEGSDRVFRGGSWDWYANDCHFSVRFGFRPGGANTGLGVRAVLSPGQ
jgi:sulfatase modifying factor 1